MPSGREPQGPGATLACGHGGTLVLTQGRARVSGDGREIRSLTFLKVEMVLKGYRLFGKPKGKQPPAKGGATPTIADRFPHFDLQRGKFR